LISLLSFLLKIYFIIRKVTNGKKHKVDSITIIELQNGVQPFSFLNYIFLDKESLNNELIMRHERVHILQRHTFDILHFELIKIICWFNPLIWFIKADLRLVHEFLADEGSIGSASDKYNYALCLIQNSLTIPRSTITTPIFNQSFLKKRISMLHKAKTPSKARLRLLLVLPLLAGMVVLSTLAFTKKYNYIDLYTLKPSPSSILTPWAPQSESTDYF